MSLPLVATASAIQERTLPGPAERLNDSTGQATPTIGSDGLSEIGANKANVNTDLRKLEIDEKVLPDTIDDDLWIHDQDHPRNWTSRRKWTSVLVIGLYCFMAPLPSSMMAPALPQVAEQYGITDQTVLALTLSIFLISFALGPLVLSPLSEMYGRTLIYHISNIFNVAFNLGSAFSPNTTSLLVLRFLTGFSSSAPPAIANGSISDLFSENDRASAMAILTLAPLLGPTLGPIAGGYITQSLGVKWLFILIAILCAISSVIGIPLLRETYAPVIRWKRAIKEGNVEVAERLNPSVLAAHGGTKSQVIWTNLSRPVVLLTRSYVCFLLSLYQAFNYGMFLTGLNPITHIISLLPWLREGIYYLMFATFAKFFRDTYGFGPGIGGLMYFGLGFGFMAATFACAKFSDRLYMKLSAKNGGKGTPEMRMPVLMIASVICPIGLLWYGWSAQAKLHWIMPVIGTTIYGAGVMTAYLPIQLYLIDAFTFAASVTGAASVFRSMLGFAFPLFGQQMTDRLGYGGSCTLLAGIAIVIGIPFPIYLYFKGADIRARSPYTR
ncbi:major facilitator superfamily domain-containing protein [Ephemerocybe angulata]|uniref:Major facilitator superfamily domain-containing protein n=1 Tax=Ephemerocybe angulata TaxID=980116 RepID=A0A8H6HWN3_9AGAR|nr:major facilitator superfamily domain-containing protein [Tulosesus angulatus]